jgi:hypothetical protein
MRPWFALGPSLHLRWVVAGPLFADLAGALMFPVTRDRVYLAPDITLHQVGLAAGSGEIALGVAFR